MRGGRRRGLALKSLRGVWGEEGRLGVSQSQLGVLVLLLLGLCF